MPEKRPFERLPADVSPINYSLCLKPDLLDFTFEGKLEAAAQVRRPSGAGGELPGKQLGRACGLGWGPVLEGGGGGLAWALRAWGWGGRLRDRRAPLGRPRGAGAGVLFPAGLGPGPRCGERRGRRRAGPVRPSGASTPVWGIPLTPGTSRFVSVLGEAGGCWERPEGHRSLNLLTQFFLWFFLRPTEDTLEGTVI